MGAARKLYEELADHLASLVAAGSLRPGDRLPSVRALAGQQGVSASTVVQAYLLLENRGVVEVRPQSGHYVKAAQPRPTLPDEPRTPRHLPAPRPVTVADRVARLYGSLSDDRVNALGVAVPDARLLPTDKINRILARIARDAGAAGVAYAPPQGLGILRRELSRRSPAWGSGIQAEELVITLGAMEAIHLCLRAVSRRGDTVAVETPAYYGVLQLLESMGLRVVEIPSHAGTGLDLAVLAQTLKKRRPKAILTVPSFANPLGSLMPDEARKELVQLATRHDVPVIEDDIYGDLHFDPTRPRLARAFDEKGMVMVCSSLSKTVAPGYRIGWAAPGRYREAVERLKFAQTVSSPAIPQMAAAEFLRSGGYDHHLRSLRRHLADQVARYSDEIAARFPAGTRVSRPRGGFVLWVELPPGTDSLELQERALREGVIVAPGPIFSASGRFRNFLRINCGHPWEDPTAAALQKVARLAHQLG